MTRKKKRPPKAKRPRRRKGPPPRRDREGNGSEAHASGFNPRVSAKLKPVLQHIGVPERQPFKPDPFQVEAMERLAEADVVVSAPTGSGKTWIAEQAIARALEQGQRAWYASPLKALSNAKHQEFGERFGPENVGILTGDRKENMGAPLIVGTTEILRNQLYDVMNTGGDLDAGLVVLDEAHFLGDPDRGVVWEEVIIYLPPRVRLLLLSATVANADQISRWLSFVRDEPCATVLSTQRPVPLFPVFLLPDGELTPLKKSNGQLFGPVEHFVEREESQRRRGPLAHVPPFGQILAALEEADMLPAIFFLKSRSDCDKALSHVAAARLEVSPETRLALDEFLAEELERHPFLADHPQVDTLRTLHVGGHHAGHLLHWRLLVERAMQKGLLKAIFSTSTVAAGVNFPARTVVITQSDRFDGRDFTDLTATDLLQMTGRAGRRGMDNIGFACVVPGPYNNIRLISSLLDADPDPVLSQLHINFSMVLNLLLSQKPAEIKELLSSSLATFQRLERHEGQEAGKAQAGVKRLMKQAAQLLQATDCPGPEEAVVRRRRRRQLADHHQRLVDELASLEGRQGLWAAMTRGRVFMDMFGALAVVVHREERGDMPGVLAVSLESERRLTKGRPRLDFVPADEVAGVFSEVLRLPKAGGGRALAQAVLDQYPFDPTPLPHEELEELGRAETERLRQRLEEAEGELAMLDCAMCPSREDCLEGQGELGKVLDKAEAVMNLVQEESHAFWYDFVRHLEFLRAEGFVDAQGRLTEDGRWASQLRLDQPVLIAQAIRDGALPNNDPVLLAALVALFVDDKEREGGGRYLSQRLKDGISGLVLKLDPLLGRLRQWGFSTPPMPYAAAGGVFVWALGAEFVDAVAVHGGAEGDLANLIYRTADNLRQLISLRDTHPRLVATAREAVDLLLRPPVVIPD